jgi:hypothetical protein
VTGCCVYGNEPSGSIKGELVMHRERLQFNGNVRFR